MKKYIALVLLFIGIVGCSLEKRVAKQYAQLDSYEIDFMRSFNIEGVRKYLYGIEYKSDTLNFHGAFYGGYQRGKLSLKFLPPDTTLFKDEKAYFPKNQEEEMRITNVAKQIMKFRHENKLRWVSGLSVDGLLQIGIEDGVLYLGDYNKIPQHEKERYVINELHLGVYYRVW